MDKMGLNRMLIDEYNDFFSPSEIISQKQEAYIQQVIQANPKLAKFSMEFTPRTRTDYGAYVYQYQAKSKKKYKLYKRETQPDNKIKYVEIPVISQRNHVEFNPNLN